MALMSLGVADLADDALVATGALKTDQVHDLSVVVGSSLALGVNILLCHKYYSIEVRVAFYFINHNPFLLWYWCTTTVHPLVFWGWLKSWVSIKRSKKSSLWGLRICCLRPAKAANGLSATIMKYVSITLWRKWSPVLRQFWRSSAIFKSWSWSSNSLWFKKMGLTDWWL